MCREVQALYRSCSCPAMYVSLQARPVTPGDIATLGWNRWLLVSLAFLVSSVHDGSFNCLSWPVLVGAVWYVISAQKVVEVVEAWA